VKHISASPNYAKTHAPPVSISGDVGNGGSAFKESPDGKTKTENIVEGAAMSKDREIKRYILKDDSNDWAMMVDHPHGGWCEWNDVQKRLDGMYGERFIELKTALDALNRATVHNIGDRLSDVQQAIMRWESNNE
jgi:hypothetical protein